LIAFAANAAKCGTGDCIRTMGEKTSTKWCFINAPNVTFAGPKPKNNEEKI
jgi:hypothetical protein